MATFNFTLDTGQMADRIQEVNRGVGVVGTAVTAMEAAVIASERAATEKICKSIDSGFFMLLRSRLSQKVAQFAARMHSQVGSMGETASAIDRTHQQMQEDFNRIKARYLKVFETLDDNLETRVRTLDADAMSLARARSELLAGRICSGAPAALYYTTDTCGVALKASNARLKARSQFSIDDISEGARRIQSYERMCGSVLEEGKEPHDCLVPVVYTVAESVAYEGSYSLGVTVPEVLDARTGETISRGMLRAQNVLLDDAHATDMGAVRASYVDQVRVGGMDERVQETMIELFDASFARQGRGGVS